MRVARDRLQPFRSVAARRNQQVDGRTRFEGKGIEPGRYRLWAARNGYVRQEYGQRDPSRPGTILTLAPGVTDTDGDGKPNVHGAREVDFQTRLSGVNITDPFGGEDTAQINIEAKNG